MIGVYAHTQRLTERITLPGTETVNDLGGGATETTYAAGKKIKAVVKAIGRGREHLQARQIVGTTPYEVTVYRKDVPDLSGDDVITWHSKRGDVELTLQEPPALHTNDRYVRFIAAGQE